MRRLPLALALAASLALAVAGCTTPPTVTEPDAPAVRAPDAAPPQPSTPAREPEVAAEATERDSDVTSGAAPRPDWLGTRVLPLAADGFGERLPTPAELVDRRLVTPPLPPPAPSSPADERFTAEIWPVPRTVLERSTWTEACPVGVEDLRYLIVHHFGFDGRVHVGELLVHADVADDVVEVFSALYRARFPLEEIRVIRMDELSAPPTGDGNVTTAFVCRPTVGGTRWSEHAYGRAIDLNPFHNPYVRGDLVIPELADAYVDRTDIRPGMIVAGDAVTEAFASIGWGWGGDWSGPATDPMHFSVSGR